MRILHLAAYPLYSGPMPQTLALAAAQRDLGHEVVVVCDRVRGNFSGFEESIMPHLRQGDWLPLPKWAEKLVLSTKAPIWQHARDAWNLRQICREAQVDVIHTHLSHDHTLLAWAPSHNVVRVRTLHAARSLVARLGQRSLLTRCDALITRCAPHQQKAQVLLRQSRKIPIACIEGSMDTDTWLLAANTRAQHRQHLRTQLGIPQDAFVFGQAALVEHRGQKQLMQALAGAPQLKRAHALIIGDGAQRRELEAMRTQWNLQARVHFLGYVAYPQLRDLFAAIDVACVLKLGNDASGRAALEPMAAGVPIVAPLQGALKPLVAQRVWGTPLPEQWDVGALQQALLRAQWDSEIAPQRGLEAQKWLQIHRSRQAEAEQTLQLYTDAASLRLTP